MGEFTGQGSIFQNVRVENAGPCILKEGVYARDLIESQRDDAFQGLQDGFTLDI